MGGYDRQRIDRWKSKSFSKKQYIPLELCYFLSIQGIEGSCQGRLGFDNYKTHISTFFSCKSYSSGIVIYDICNPILGFVHRQECNAAA